MSETCGQCDRKATWTWHDGMWSGGRYCDEHIREKLDKRADFPDHRDEITTETNVTTIGGGRTRIVTAGARPLGGGPYPTIRTKEAFDEHRDSTETGDRES